MRTTVAETDATEALEAHGLLGYDKVAERVGLSPATIRSYRHAGGFPPPDTHVGREPLWWVETVDEWKRTREGDG